MVFKHKHFFKILNCQSYDDYWNLANRFNVSGYCADCNKELRIAFLLEYNKNLKDHLKYINPPNCYRIEFDAFYEIN